MQGQRGPLRRRRARARQEAAEGERPWPRTLSKRDAAVWVRAVRRFGLEARLPEIAREVGPALEGAPHSALCAAPQLVWAVRPCWPAGRAPGTCARRLVASFVDRAHQAPEHDDRELAPNVNEAVVAAASLHQLAARLPGWRAGASWIRARLLLLCHAGETDLLCLAPAAAVRLIPCAGARCGPGCWRRASGWSARRRRPPSATPASWTGSASPSRRPRSPRTWRACACWRARCAPRRPRARHWPA